MRPQTIEELQEMVRSRPRLRVRGGGSKPALSPPEEHESTLHMSGMAGMVEYDPVEYTFVALAGTRIETIEQQLAVHGQYLPFDPPLVGHGATLGGTVAAGLSGAGRYRYGGVRDFLLGVRFVDGQGNLVRGGGKVVKNAAGFDLPKLMIGSLGQFGVLVDLAFKVFPRPVAYVTITYTYASLEGALGALNRLSASPLEIFALEVEPQVEGVELLVRLGGQPDTLKARVARLEKTLEQPPAVEDFSSQEAEIWENRGEFAWVPPQNLLVKVPLSPSKAPVLDKQLAKNGCVRRYSAGASQAWIGWPGNVQTLHTLLEELELPGLVIRGLAPQPLIGRQAGDEFARRVRAALDPEQKFSQAYPDHLLGSEAVQTHRREYFEMTG